jgi:TolB-like protein
MSQPSPPQRLIRFGVFEADLVARELHKNGVKVRLQDQPFQVLALLLEHPGQVVTREELRQKLWSADTFVDFDNGLNTTINKIREALRDSSENPRFIETLPRRGYRFLGSTDEPREAVAKRGGPIDSIAVLPLENLSRDPEQEYFADGLTEALITNLAKISALRVVSRTSAMHYKGVHRPLPEIARELGVEAVVEGTVQRFGERVRISAQLVNAAKDKQVWAESYDRDLRDVLTLQSEVAQAIAREVRVKLTPAEQAHFVRARKVNPEAYLAYLKGRYHWNKRSGESVRRGAEYFQRAVDTDPTYGAAYAGLADSAGVAGWWRYVSPEQGCGRAKAAALKALAIEETAEAHTSLGWAIMHYDWEYLAAEGEYQRAIELNPQYATAHQWYGQCLGYMGRFDQAFAEFRHALHLEPLSQIINISASAIRWLAGEYDRAIELAQKTLELDPAFLPGLWALVRAFDTKGHHDSAIACAERAVKLSGGATLFVTELGQTYAAAGRIDEALKVVREMQDVSKRCYVDSGSIARIYASLNEKDQAFRWLETAYQEHAPSMAYVKFDHTLANLRSDPRFDDVLRRIGLHSDHGDGLRLKSVRP